MSLKCNSCGLVNFATAETCKRCGKPLTTGEVRLTETAAGTSILVTEDGYVLPPPPSIGLTPGTGVWRDGVKLVMSKGASLPDRCIKCNQPALGQRLKRSLSWHHPALYLIIFVALLVYLIVAMILRKTTTVEIGLCSEHLARRRRAVILTTLLGVLGVLALLAAIAAADGVYALIGLLLLLGAAIYGIVSARVVVASKIDNQFVWLKGVNKDYLDSLPVWPV